MPSFDTSKPEEITIAATLQFPRDANPDPPETNIKHQERKPHPSFRKSLRHGLWFFKNKPPVQELSSTNVCMFCNRRGHWSNDCPLKCASCKKRGHEAKTCSPVCSVCEGSGVIRREDGDERMPSVLEFQAAVAGVRKAAAKLRQDIYEAEQVRRDEGLRRGDGVGEESGEGGIQWAQGVAGRHDSVQRPHDAAVLEEMHANLGFMMVWANQVEADMKKLGVFEVVATNE